MPGQSEGPKRGSKDGDALGEKQEELNESVATGEDETPTADEESDKSFPASDPPANY